MHPWGASGYTSSSARLPASTQRLAKNSVSSIRWSAVPTVNSAGGMPPSSAYRGDTSGSRRSSTDIPARNWSTMKRMSSGSSMSASVVRPIPIALGVELRS